MSSGTHGGNIDWSGMVAGITMYFPVEVPGALFCLGDAHALQGDGEITNEAIEIDMKVRFTAWTVKKWKIKWPRGEDADYIFAIGCEARPLEQSLQAATSEMCQWLQTDYKLDRRSAAILMGVSVKYEVGNVVDPALTMVCKMPKSVLRRFGTSPYDQPTQNLAAEKKL
jgi:acetamidase/formamidase